MKIKDNLKNIIKYPLILLFVGFIVGIFFLYMIFPDKEISEWENRYLSKAPEVRISDIADGTFMTKYEEYINDQIPMRDAFIKLKAICEICTFKIENNGIAKGKASYLFTKNTGDSSIFDKNISIISQFVESIDNPVKIAIAPNACGVLESNVPKGFAIVNQAAKLDELYGDKTLLKSAAVVDLKSVLNAHEDEYIYYKTDHHWTTLGAYYAYREISDNPVDISLVEKEIGAQYSDGFYGTLYAKYKGLFVDSDVITYYDIPVKEYVTDDTLRDGLLDKEKLGVFDKYGMFMYGNFGESKITTNAENGKELIVFKDSYANCLIPFLTYDYEYITIIDLRYYKGSVTELMNNNKSADVLFINNFDFVNEDNHFYKLMK